MSVWGVGGACAARRDEVGRRVELVGERVVDVDDDDLVVELALVDELEVAEDLDRAHLAHLPYRAIHGDKGDGRAGTATR